MKLTLTPVPDISSIIYGSAFDNETLSSLLKVPSSHEVLLPERGELGGNDVAPKSFIRMQAFIRN